LLWRIFSWTDLTISTNSFAVVSSLGIVYSCSLV